MLVQFFVLASLGSPVEGSPVEGSPVERPQAPSLSEPSRTGEKALRQALDQVRPKGLLRLDLTRLSASGPAGQLETDGSASLLWSGPRLFSVQVQGQWGDGAKAVRNQGTMVFDSLTRGTAPEKEEAPAGDLDAWTTIDSRTSSGILPYFLQGASSLDDLLTKESEVTADGAESASMSVVVTKTKFGTLHFGFQRSGGKWTLQSLERRRVVSDNPWLPSVIREEVGAWIPLRQAPAGAFSLDPVRL